MIHTSWASLVYLCSCEGMVVGSGGITLRVGYYNGAIENCQEGLSNFGNYLIRFFKSELE